MPTAAYTSQPYSWTGRTHLEAYAGSSADYYHILRERRMRDVVNDIAILDANNNALTSILLRLRTKSCRDPKFEWFEDEFLSMTTTTDAADSSTDDTLSPEDAIGRVGDLWLNGDSGEMIYITAIASGDWTVVRGVGGTDATDVATTDNWYYISNAQETGDTARESLVSQTVQHYNYCQLVKEAYEVDETAIATALYGGPELKHLRRKHGETHKRDLERMLWFGVRDDLNASNDSNISSQAHMSKGIISVSGTSGFITSNVLSNASGAYTEAEFISDLQTAFRYGNGRKTLFAAPHAITVIDGWAGSSSRYSINLTPGAKALGINVTRFISPHGELNIVNNKLFGDMSGTDATGMFDVTKLAVILDLENIWLRTLRATRLEMGIQENDRDAVEEQYLTEAGLHLELEETCAIIKDFDNA